MMRLVLDPLARTFKFDARLSAGQLLPFEGEPLPRIRDGAIVEVSVAAYALEDEDIRERAFVPRRNTLFPKGTTLFLEMSGRAKGEALISLESLGPSTWTTERTVGPLVEAILDEPLILETTGNKPGFLLACACSLPALDEAATSLNDAFTIASNACEKHRRTHTGNVFEKAWWMDGSARALTFRRLEDARRRAHEQGVWEQA